ncbi:MAG: hypothetical protein M3R45_12735 [Pseudomonadota bacterium]|nr:hypothetical protein [Pseudomonadota bacterium]
MTKTSAWPAPARLEPAALSSGVSRVPSRRRAGRIGGDVALADVFCAGYMDERLQDEVTNPCRAQSE